MFDPVLLVSVVAMATIYALSAYALVVTYRVTGVFNLALGFQAALAAFLYWQLTVGWGIDKYLSAIVVVGVLAPLLGLAIQQTLFRKRRDVLTAIIVTIGLGVAINGLMQTVWDTSVVRTVPSLFGSGFVTILGTTVTVNEIGVVVTSAVIGLLVWLLLNRSRAGLRMRAVVDGPDLAGATGIAYARMSGIAWMIGSVLAAVSGVLLAPMLNLDIVILSSLVVNAFAVAVFAGLSSLLGRIRR